MNWEEEGINQFRNRLVCSVLSSRTIKIINIRNNHEISQSIGMNESEACFLNLLEMITEGTEV